MCDQLSKYKCIWPDSHLDPSEDSQPTQALQNPGHHADFTWNPGIHVTNATPEIPPLLARASGNAHLPGGHWNSADALGRDL